MAAVTMPYPRPPHADAARPVARPAALFRPIDAGILAYFRVAFGGCLLYWSVSTLATGWATRYFVEPALHFSYPGLAWVRPLPPAGVYAEFLVLALAACLVIVGLFYHAAALAAAICFTHLFLSDRAYYLNHDYLIALVCWLMVLVPANRVFSLDAIQRRADGRPFGPTVPAVWLWLLRFQIAVPYLFGGIAKLDSDWLRGQPVWGMLGQWADAPVVGPLLSHEAAVWTFAYGGLLFDLLVVPALLWKRTRAFAFGSTLAFHLTNSALLRIGIFPWFMILATALFFDPGWPRRLLTGRRLATPAAGPCGWTRGRKAAAFAFCSYAVAQAVIPLRFLAYGENPNWTERGHLFAWHMMLRGKQAAVRFVATDRRDGRTGAVDPLDFATVHQIPAVTRDPTLLLQLARFIAADLSAQGFEDVELRAVVLTSLNGRKPQLFVDPTVDLAALPDDADPYDLALPLVEPLRRDAWDVPVAEWERHVSTDPRVVRAAARTR